MAAYLWVLEGRWPIRTSREAFAIGGSWAVLTILFEFGFGHYVVGDSWSTLLRAYNPGAGRVWAAVPLWTLLGPQVMRRCWRSRPKTWAAPRWRPAGHGAHWWSASYRRPDLDWDTPANAQPAPSK
jgi:hypothetical protein